MRSQKVVFSDLLVVLLAVAAIPAAVVLLKEGVYELVTLTAVVTVVGIAALVTGKVPYAEPRAAIETQKMPSAPAGRLAAAAARLIPIEMLDIVPAPSQPVLISVVKAQGDCPLGFHSGAAWAVDQQGHLSSPLCRPAVAAVSTLLESRPGHGKERVAACHCPLVSPPSSLSFVVLPQVGVAG